jgi:hypothetical protein
MHPKLECESVLRVAAVAAGIACSCGCATYKIESTDEYRPISVDSSTEVFVTRLNDYPEGNHCFEPMLYVLSLGIVPTHCVERYHVSNSNPSERDDVSYDTHFTVTLMQGWIALPMLLSRQWRFGYGEDAPVQIEQIVTTKVD